MAIDRNLETALAVDPVSGFMVSPRKDRITPTQKQLIIDIYRETGNLSESVRVAGMKLRDLRQLRASDEKLDDELREVELGFVEKAKGLMMLHMQRPGNYMDRVTIARRFEPGLWGNTINHEVTHHVEQMAKMAGEARKIIDTEAGADDSTMNRRQDDGTVGNERQQHVE
jgi:hypothetical protein